VDEKRKEKAEKIKEKQKDASLAKIKKLVEGKKKDNLIFSPI
jgi:hypothetical protein